MAVLYRHIRLDTNQVFYIGIGKDEKRAYNKRGRSYRWKDVAYNNEYEVQILKRDLTWEDACELEIMLIAYYGRLDLGTGILVNMTDGGEGVNGVIRSQETKDKIGLGHKGQKRSQEAILKMSKPRSERTKARMRKPKSEEHKLNIGKSNSKIVINIETGEEHPSAKIVSELFGINYSTFMQRLNGSLKNNTLFVYK